MDNKLSQINTKYNDDTYPVFPFVSGNYITIIKAGLYRKHHAKFRGVTAVYDEEKGTYTYPLYGMYNIEEDLLIVPPTVEITEEKQKLIDRMLERGYKQLSAPPTFKTLYFDSASDEAVAALQNKMQFQANNSKSQQQQLEEEALSESAIDDAFNS
jgi:hypothetical protein